MQIPTTPGETYAVTASAPCTVSAVIPHSSPLLLITIEEPGQYLIVAPTTELYVTDDSALVTRSFRSAPAACMSLRCAADGGALGEEAAQQELGEGGAQDNLNSAGFCFVSEQSGALKTVSIQGRSNREFHHNPVWLKVWKKTEAGHVLLGLSTNSAVQENNKANIWTMRENLRVTAGDIITITTHGENTKDGETCLTGGEEALLLARVTAITPQEGTGCLNDGGEPVWSYLPVCTLTFTRKVSLSQYARVHPVSPQEFENLSPKRPQTLYFIMEAPPLPESALL